MSNLRTEFYYYISVFVSHYLSSIDPPTHTGYHATLVYFWSRTDRDYPSKSSDQQASQNSSDHMGTLVFSTTDHIRTHRYTRRSQRDETHDDTRTSSTGYHDRIRSLALYAG